MARITVVKASSHSDLLRDVRGSNCQNKAHFYGQNAACKDPLSPRRFAMRLAGFDREETQYPSGIIGCTLRK
jgi:hypothetical protein